MKNVLIIDATPVFGEFLKDKLSEEKINVTFVQDKYDAIPKIISLFPDLVIVEISENDNSEYIIDFLKKVKSDPNASQVPMIATGPKLDRTEIALYAKYGLHKYFMQPIKFDVFFDSIGKILRAPFALDQTPCVLELHRNGDVIFIEIAQGLNREKLFLLKYKLTEMIDTEKIDVPKVILMMTNLELSFVDGLNLELLLNNVLLNHRILPKNIKVLSLSTFTRELIDGHEEYNGIEVATEISQVLNSLVETASSSKVSDLVSDKLLKNNDENEGSIEMRFLSDSPLEERKSLSTVENKKIAIVDDDSVILDLLSSAFRNKGFIPETFSSSQNFLNIAKKNNYAAIILDILMPGVSGFEVLKQLRTYKNETPILVYSQALKKEIVIQALSLGAKQYFTKPQKPEIIVNRTIEVINGTKQ